MPVELVLFRRGVVDQRLPPARRSPPLPPPPRGFLSRGRALIRALKMRQGWSRRHVRFPEVGCPVTLANLLAGDTEMPPCEQRKAGHHTPDGMPLIDMRMVTRIATRPRIDER